MKNIFLACFLISKIHGLEYVPQFENDQICVARVKVEPNEEIGFHRDAYSQVVIALKGGTITRIEADGSFTDVQFPTGVAVIRSPDPENELHRSLNASSEPIDLIIIQLKNE